MPKALPQSYKGISIRPRNVVLEATGELVPWKEAQAALRKDIKTLQALVQWQLDAADQALVDKLDTCTGKAASGLGAPLGLRLPKDFFEEQAWGPSGRNRFERAWVGETVALLRSWQARKKVTEGTSTAFVSAGWRRTADATRPRAGARMNLGLVDAQYCSWLDRNTLRLVIGGHWHLLSFAWPRRLEGRSPSLPTLRFDKAGRVVFDFAFGRPYQQGPVSTRYVVGVDVNIGQAVVASVWDAKRGKPVEQTALSPRVHSLSNSVRATQAQVAALQKKARRAQTQGRREARRAALLEAKCQREALSRKRKELAIIMAQEVAALAYQWGNAVVALEDLSHISNTMKYGRWPRGLFAKWVSHFVELNGSRVLKVNAAFTSQLCSACQGQLVFKTYHRTRCPECGKHEDRDYNAASNIAQRAAPSVRRMTDTRKKSSRYTSKKSVQESPTPPPVLKHPGQARRRRAEARTGTPAALKVVSLIDGARARRNALLCSVARDECALRPLETARPPVLSIRPLSPGLRE